MKERWQPGETGILINLTPPVQGDNDKEKMKTEFECGLAGYNEKRGHRITLQIIGSKPDFVPYLSITHAGENGETVGWLPDKDLERFAVNILKALKSKKLKESPNQND